MCRKRGFLEGNLGPIVRVEIHSKRVQSVQIGQTASIFSESGKWSSMLPEFSHLVEIATAIIFAVGVGDVFRCYLNQFSRSGGLENLLYAHLMATIAAGFRFTFYLAAIVILLFLSL